MSFWSRIRIGAVNYLNAKPLIYGLEQAVPDAEIAYDFPSRLADEMAQGRLDVALIPSIEIFSNPDYSIVSDACISCFGPVLSVKLLSRVPIENVRSLALDEGSRTSAAAVRILLRRQFGLAPEVELLPIGAVPDNIDADAVLLIGDRAIHASVDRFEEVRDVGRWWCDWSGLPLVFAVWTARAGVELEGLETILAQAREAGVAHLDAIARTEAPLLGLDEQVCLAYLRDNIQFYLGDRHRRSLEMFYREAVAMGLVPAGVNLDLDNCRITR